MWLVLAAARVLHEAGKASDGARSESGGQMHETERNESVNGTSVQGVERHSGLAPARVRDPEAFRVS